MQDFSLHLLDLLENSAKAGAGAVEVVLSYAGTWLEFALTDDGPGFPAAILENPTDPFRTTRSERPVGLGLALLRESAAATGGDLVARNRRQGGAEVRGRIDMSHIDARPLGSLAETALSAVLAWPGLDLRVLCGPVGQVAAILDTGEIKRELADLSLAHPAVRKFIRESLTVGLADLYAWADRVSEM